MANRRNIKIRNRPVLATWCTECTYFAPFVAIVFVVVLTTFLLSLPLLMACIWSVEARERSLAIGLQSCLWKLLGAIPGPIVFGLFLDTTCLVWDQGCDGDTSCISYDNRQMGRNLVIVTVIFRLPSILLYLLTYCTARSHYRPAPRDDLNDK